MATEDVLNQTEFEKTVDSFRHRLVRNLYHARGQVVQRATLHDAYMTLCYTVRDHLIDRWRKTFDARFRDQTKFVCYLSAEYLPGKQLQQNMLYSGTTEIAREALADYDLDLDDLVELDVEPGLGNGGLGRLVACFVDSLATLDMPAVGYGIRYEFGIFKQAFVDGWQVEKPDDWLLQGNPWEFPQADQMVKVGFSGKTERYCDAEGRQRSRWIPAYHVLGEPYITLVPGYGTETVNTLRLWRARATEEFDFQLFDTGDYAKAVEKKVYSENISKVLYPNDVTPEGKRLRLQQQYFFVACSIKDIIRHFRLVNDDWTRFPEKVAIQLNDTHPVVAIPELMRLLIDEYALEWEQAWEITTQTFAYTCHTLLPEALETWPLDLFGDLLPRHLEIIYEINFRFLEDVRSRYPEDERRVQRMSLIGENGDRHLRMAHLAAVASFAINGVAEIQSRLLRERTLPDFADMWPQKFQNKTNGVTPRRFMLLANPRLSKLITSRIGDSWPRHLDQLQELETCAKDETFQSAWREVKQANKRQLATILEDRTGIPINTDSVFDIMVKRLHEYKRQLLKALQIISLYHQVKADPSMHVVPTTFIFGAKAAPGYWMAKRIIKLINNLGQIIHEDPDIDGRLKVVFAPNFNVTLAERIYPAADISEQISMAGKEASGTGNMKFALNGALTVGTLDGANIEIRQRVGEENFFLFGLSAEEVFQLKQQGYQPRDYYHANPQLKQVVDSLSEGQFSGGDTELFRPIVDSLLDRDEYLLLADFHSYVDCCQRAARTYEDVNRWTRMSILNAARCGFFSSDRAMRQYARDIWRVEPHAVT